MKWGKYKTIKIITDIIIKSLHFLGVQRVNQLSLLVTSLIGNLDTVSG